MRQLVTILRAAAATFRGSLPVRLAIVILVATTAGAISSVVPALVGQALDSVLRGGVPAAHGFSGAFARALSGASPWLVVAFALVGTIAGVGLTVLGSKLGSQHAGEVTAALRIALLRRALHASPRDLDVAGAGLTAAHAPKPPAPAPTPRPTLRGPDVIKLAIVRDTGLVSDFTVSALTGLPQNVVMLALLGYELISSRAWVALAGSLALFLLSRVAAHRTSRKVAREMHGMQQSDTAVFSSVGEALTASEELRLLGAREQALREFTIAAHHCSAARARFAGVLALSTQIRTAFTAASPLLVVVALQASGGTYQPGEVAKLLLVVSLLMSRFDALDALRTGLVEREPLLAATVRVLDLAESPARREDNHHINVPGVQGEIAFDDVTFTPPGASRPVLEHVSLRIPRGAVVGICGRSGCGKSTLVRLLLRLDDPDDGTVTLDGEDLRSIEPSQLASVFGVLGQASRLLERSIADNLALGLDREPSREELITSLRAVQLDEVADGAAGSPRSLDTPFRANPPNFSGGEQRRLLLARMLVRDARVMVLDEPEAGLPSATAEQLLRMVASVAQGRTCLVVTHAPHLLGSAFNVVMDAGKVVATGEHAELLASSEVYQSLMAEGLKKLGG